MNRRLCPAAAAVFVLSLMCFACGGGHGGGSGPTEPPAPTGKRLQFTISAALGNFSGALLESAASFDGREVGRTDWTRAGGACTEVCGIAADVQGISPGSHTVRYTVVRQDRALIDYVVVFSGIISDPATGSRETVTSPPQQRRLRAGESVTFTVRI